MVGRTVGTGVRVAEGVAVGCAALVGAVVGVSEASIVKGRVGYGVDVRSGLWEDSVLGFVVIILFSAGFVAENTGIDRAGRPQDHNIKTRI
jgi:hypothetical protein